MLLEEEKAKIIDLIAILEVGDIFDLAKTSTNGLIKPISTEDAINAILLHTTDFRSFLLRKKITKSVLFKYLHNKNISFPGNAEKTALVELVVNYWTQDRSVVTQLQAEPYLQTNDETVECLAQKFSEWFYNKVNLITANHVSNVSSCDTLKEEDFWNDAKMCVKLSHGADDIKEYSSENSADCIALLNHISNEFSLSFLPNLSKEGTKGVSEAHGLVLVMSCGTLYSTVSQQCVGLFEQIFGLIRDPMSNHNWKIKHSKLNLKSQQVSSLPVLSKNVLSISK